MEEVEDLPGKTSTPLYFPPGIWMLIDMGKVRVAVPTKAHAGLDDVVSEVFGRAGTFTIIDIEDGTIISVYILDNPASSYKHGSGPIVVKTLIDLNVNVVLAAELGLGASELLNYHNIRVILVKPNTKVADAIKENLAILEK